MIDAGAPFTVAEFPVGWAVLNSAGYNVLTFPEKPGAKFTTLEHATQICDRLNAPIPNP